MPILHMALCPQSSIQPVSYCLKYSSRILLPLVLCYLSAISVAEILKSMPLPTDFIYFNYFASIFEAASLRLLQMVHISLPLVFPLTTSYIQNCFSANISPSHLISEFLLLQNCQHRNTCSDAIFIT